MINYPLKFKPILHQKIWGGDKLKNQLNKNTALDNVGESWEISTVPGSVSIVENGEYAGWTLIDLIKEFKGDLVGDKVYEQFGNEFPLLIKFIDAKENLSVQLHPNDELAKKRHNSFGKTEMWYVMDADEDSKLQIGFNQPITKEKYLENLKLGKILDILNFEKPKKGDSYFIKPGTVHAIGAGCLIAEIQQTSDVTYRIYDWDRVDDKGSSRELHTDLAVEAIGYHYESNGKCNYESKINKSINIVTCEYFTTNILQVKGELVKDYSELDSFVILMCVDGEGKIIVNKNKEVIKKGETILITKQTDEVVFKSELVKLLEVYI